MAQNISKNCKYWLIRRNFRPPSRKNLLIYREHHTHLFNLYEEWLVKRILEDFGDFTVGGCRIKTINNLDDQVVLAKTEKEESMLSE